MANQQVGSTALGAAVCRLLEQFQPEESRLFLDPVVSGLVGTPVRLLMQFAGMRRLTITQTDVIMPGIYGVQVCRTRCIDDAVLAALAGDIEQVVILGAGFDTRAYRLAGIERTRVLEVDLPSVQNIKKRRLQQRFAHLPEHVTFVPIDFAIQSVETALQGTTFDPARPAVFIWEGVTQYIPEEAVSRVLTFIGKAAPGSLLVFTYVLRSIIERRSDLPGADKLMNMMDKRRTSWLFGLDPADLASFLATHHLHLLADTGNADYQERYLKPLGRELVVSECERVVQATVLPD